MLAAPDVCKGKPAHVRESGNLRFLVLGVVSPDVSDKHLHQVDVLIVVVRVVPSNWQVKMNLDPPLEGLP